MVGSVKKRGSKAPANEPVIDAEFQSRIPPLTDEEEGLLEDSLATYGCLDAIKTWGGKVLDGHNRFRLCKKLGIKYRTEDVPLLDREAALDYIDRTQLGRRNLHPDTASLLRGRVYNRRKQKVGRPPTGEKICHSDIFSGDKPSETHKQLAEEFGVSPRTVNRDGAYAAAVDTLKPITPNLEAQVIRGEGPPRKRVIEAALAAQESPEKAREILTTKPDPNPRSKSQPPAAAPPVPSPAQAAASPEPSPTPAPQQQPPAQELPSRTPYLEAGRAVIGNDVPIKTTEFDEKWSDKLFFCLPHDCDQEQGDNLIGKLATHVLLQEVSEAIAIVVSDTGSERFELMSGVASALCFPKNTPYTVFYFGADPGPFVERFKEFGNILVGFTVYQLALKKLSFAKKRLNDLDQAAARVASIQTEAAKPE